MAFALGALALSAVLSIVTYQLARTYLLHHRETSVLRQTYANARLVKAVLRTPEPDVPRLLASVELPAGSTAVLLHDGNWFGATVTVGPNSIPLDLRRSVMDGAAVRQRFLLEGVPRLGVGIPLPAVDGAYIEVFPLSELDRTLRVLRNSLVAAALLTAAAGATLGRLASRRLLAPVAKVSDAAVAVAQGQLDARLDEGDDPDLSAMAVSFNRMTDALKARVERDARFASDVSHELRSPLTTLAAAMEVVVARQDEMPERAREGVALLAGEVQRFTRLVEDLLEISRFDAGVAELSPTDVVLAEFVLHAVRARGDELVPVEVQAEAAATVVRADKRRLEQALANLLDNARRHGGGVERVRVERDGRWAVVAVEDRGPGVPPDERERIFERFARGRAAGKRDDTDGTGLGLALVREHVRLHGGDVRAEDGPGGGARFVVELPTLEP